MINSRGAMMTPRVNSVVEQISPSPGRFLRHFSAVPLASGGKGKNNSMDPVANGDAAVEQPKLAEVPSLPFVGSMIPAHSGAPKFEMTKQYDYGMQIREKFGDFYKIGVPGFGIGLHGTMYNIIDPREMMKVVRNEGAFPSGIVEKIWSFRRVFKETNSAMVDGEDYGLLDRGERWKKLRTYLQKGMLDPKAAKGFLPGIITAAEMASHVAPLHQKDLNQFLNYSAFDMFNSFMFGELTGTAAAVGQNSSDMNEENDKFVQAALRGMECAAKFGETPSEYIINEKLGLKSELYKEFEAHFHIVQEIGRKKIRSFFERYESDDLDEFEKASYLAGAIDRLTAEGSDGVTKEEMIELCMFALFVGVDTTSSVTAWNLVHLALNPEVQEKLHAELSDAVATGGGKLNANVLSKSTSPYLHSVVRESHRLTPAFVQALWKQNSTSEVDIHGVTIPKGSFFTLNHISYDPTYVEDPREFRPERWSAESVASRVGTRSELVDHPILRDPFSQGARRCPGSRVASNEVLAMVSQLVLDWKISSPVRSLDEIKYDSSPIKPMIPELEFTARM